MRRLLSPATAVMAAVGAGVALLLGGGAPALLLGAAGGVALRAAATYTRAQSTAPRIDPFALRDPWRRFMQDALQAQSRFAHTVAEVRDGPLRDRLDEIGARLAAGVDDFWLVAQQGQALQDARRQIKADRIRGELDQIDDGDPRTRSLQSQLDTAARLDTVLDETRSRLSLLDARLDEAVARSLELSVRGADPAALGEVGSTIDDVAIEMEALHQALEETDGESGGQTGVLGA